MRAFDLDQFMSIIDDMKETVRSDRSIDSRDSIELLQAIRTLGRLVRKGELDDPVYGRVLRACQREKSLQDYPAQLLAFLPEMAELTTSQG
ncbi:MAG: hypothetical protein R3F46_07510 [bacterium]